MSREQQREYKPNNPWLVVDKKTGGLIDRHYSQGTENTRSLVNVNIIIHHQNRPKRK